MSSGCEIETDMMQFVEMCSDNNKPCKGIVMRINKTPRWGECLCRKKNESENDRGLIVRMDRTVRMEEVVR